MQTYIKTRNAFRSLKKNNLIEAENVFCELLQMNPNSSLLWVGLAKVYEAKLEIEVAQKCYKKALSLTNDKFGFAFKHYLIFILNNKLVKNIECLFKKYIAAKPSFIGPKWIYIQFWPNLNHVEFSEVISYCDELIFQNIYIVEVSLVAAQISSKVYEKELTIKYLNNISNYMTTDSEFYSTVSRVYYDIGDLYSALINIQKAIFHNSSNLENVRFMNDIKATNNIMFQSDSGKILYIKLKQGIINTKTIDKEIEWEYSYEKMNVPFIIEIANFYFYKKDNREMALKYAYKAYKESHKSEEALILLADILLDADRFEEMLVLISEFLSTKKTSSAFYYKAIAYYYLSNFKYAMFCIDSALNIDNKNAESWLLKSACLYYLKKFSLALNCINNAIEFGDNSVLFDVLKAKILYEIDKKKFLEFTTKTLALINDENYFYEFCFEIVNFANLEKNSKSLASYLLNKAIIRDLNDTNLVELKNDLNLKH